MSSRILLIIPAYRESERLGPWLDELLPALEEEGNVVVRVVDDGSSEEETAAMKAQVDKRRAKHPGLEALLVLPENQGKGGAIHTGWRERGGFDWVGFTDADGAVPAGEIARMIRAARSVPPRSYFASRVKMLGRKVDRKLSRHIVGRVFATLVSEGLGIEVYDSQCGLKLLPVEHYNLVEDQLVERGFAIDVDLLVSLVDQNCEISEFPVDWKDIPGSKVHVLRDSMRMARSVIDIRQRRRS